MTLIPFFLLVLSITMSDIEGYRLGIQTERDYEPHQDSQEDASDYDLATMGLVKVIL